MVRQPDLASQAHGRIEVGTVAGIKRIEAKVEIGANILRDGTETTNPLDINRGLVSDVEDPYHGRRLGHRLGINETITIDMTNVDAPETGHRSGMIIRTSEGGWKRGDSETSYDSKVGHRYQIR
ncbi:hypothetical protein MPER_11328 [Moniliophthora perniciosa FA553]|nr:hypothetical protein MPER_11328 [Moniliophthora perniciosa FA553]